MSGYVPGPQSADWGRERTHIRGPWPVVLVLLDLRYWDDPRCCAYQNRPSIRALAETWGWHRAKVARILRKRDKSETVARQERDKSETTDAGSTRNKKGKRDSSETAARQERDNSETPLDTRARTSPTPTPTPKTHLRILSALKGREVTTAGKIAQAAIANFFKKTGASVEEVELVARAFHKCPHPYFAHDVRAEDWEGGTDRRKSLTTLLVQSRWEDRLEAATEWQTTPAKSKGFDLAEWERNLPASVRANMEPR